MRGGITDRQRTSLRGFGRDLGQLASGFLLPAAGISTGRALVLLLCTALLALGGAALLIALLTQIGTGWLAADLRRQVFPYLDPVLRFAGQSRPITLAASAAGLGLLGVLGLGQRLEGGYRRRWWALAALLTLLVVSTAVDVAFTEGNGAVMEALNRRSAPAFWGTAVGLIVVELLCLPIQYLNTYGQQRWALAWRHCRTRDLQRAYLSDRSYYRLEADPPLQQRIDNPDQRIAEDIQRAVASATTLFFGFVTSLLALGAYILVLFRISAVLVLSLALASLIGNGVIGQMVRRLASLGFRQQALEADYRFGLVHVRSHAESLAFLRGEGAVAAGLGKRFQALLGNLERLIRWRSLVEQSSGLYSFLMQFVPYLVLSSAYFSGRVSLGDLTVGSIAFAQVQGALSFLIDRADSVSSLFASQRRCAEIGEALPPAASLPPQHAPVSSGRKHPEGWAAAGLALRGLTVAHPSGGEPLVSQLDLKLEPGERLLIRGPSGCGKTSLLRVLCGLAAPAGGHLDLPAAGRILALPQQPFLLLGSLREQLLFPGPHPGERAPSDAELRRLLDTVGLGELADRQADLDGEDDWSRVLSGGEQQRLGFARLLWRRPGLAILDEASSALDLAAEGHLYGLLVAQGITLVSVGHRPSLRRFHRRELHLDGQGGWALQGPGADG